MFVVILARLYFHNHVPDSIALSTHKTSGRSVSGTTSPSPNQPCTRKVGVWGTRAPGV